ncbi:MAG TPA: ABC transporter permease [Bacteroidia bacterium]|nr:ABC transporter permease [Bacteroidia bacterium]
MKKILIIIQREYFNRVKNRTFIILCLVAPLLFAGVIIVPSLLAGQPNAPRKIVVVDESGCPDSMSYAMMFHDTANLHFDYDHLYWNLAKVEKLYKDSEQVSILDVPANFMGGCSADSSVVHSMGLSVILKSKNEPGFATLSLLSNIMSTEVQKDMMKVSHVPQQAIDLSLKKILVEDEIKGKIQVGEVKAAVGLGSGMLIYFYVLLFGVMVMKSVVEEKSNRIVEVIISSVRPIELMMGKIIAVLFAGLTQLAVWIILSSLILFPIIHKIQDDATDVTRALNQPSVGTVVNPEKSILSFNITQETKDTIDTIMSIPWGNVIPIFIFYFVFGYLMYAAIFAAVGSAVDTDADTSQFSVVVTIPKIIAILSFPAVMNDPDGPIAKWLSMIPFTSPIIMMMRIPFGGVWPWELYLSMAILVASFYIMTWIAARIYRVGILMYGKKNSWRELGKWLFYKA